MAEQWLSIVEYARGLSISDMTVRRRIKTGKLQALLKDGKYYIPVSKLTESQKKALSSTDDGDFGQVPKPAMETPSPRPQLGAIRASFPHHSKPTRLEDERHLKMLSEPLGITPVQKSNGYEGEAWLKQCHSLVDSFKEALEQKYSATIAAQKEKILRLEEQIAHAHQQVEDLNLLVKILEKRMNSHQKKLGDIA